MDTSLGKCLCVNVCVCVCMCAFWVECYLLHSYSYSDLENNLIDKKCMFFAKT